MLLAFIFFAIMMSFLLWRFYPDFTRMRENQSAERRIKAITRTAVRDMNNAVKRENRLW